MTDTIFTVAFPTRIIWDGGRGTMKLAEDVVRDVWMSGWFKNAWEGGLVSVRTNGTLLVEVSTRHQLTDSEKEVLAQQVVEHQNRLGIPRLTDAQREAIIFPRAA